MKRRTFLRNTGLAGAGITILNFPVFGKSAPSNKIVVAVMGVNSRGAYLAKCFAEMENTAVAYICDVEEKAIANGLEAVKDTASKPRVIKDVRELVKKKDFDALVIAAPDHWHAPGTLLGVANGKHVYVEKPCGHNAKEGEMLVAASAKYRKLIQMGNQRRSYPTLVEAVGLVRDGIIGKPYFAKAWYANNRKSIGIGKKIPVPSTLDFELWQGPAPRRDYKDNLVHYNWHWFWHWGTAETCNNGTHEIDCCRWFLGVDFPSKVTSSGGRYAYKDDWEMADTQFVGFEFEGKGISWEGRSCNHYPVEGSGRGFTIYGEKGTLVNNGGAEYKIFNDKNELIREVKTEVKTEAGNTVSASGEIELHHLRNFLQAIRGESTLNAPIEDASKSVLLCHLANISQRTGRTLHCNPANGHILNDTEAMKLWGRSYEKGWEPVV